MDERPIVVVPVLTDEITDRLLESSLSGLTPLEQDIFLTRLRLYWPDVVRPLSLLYGERDDFADWATRLLEMVAQGYADRPSELRLLDLQRQSQPDWFQQPGMLGYVCYADRFAGTLNGAAEKIPYLKELGVTYLHLMPLLNPRPNPMTAVTQSLIIGKLTRCWVP
ncbi:MAG: hypothetical protein R3C44_24830 [Chloroflexota bacterium]